MNGPKSRMLGVTLTVMLALAASSASADYVINGSFEDPALPPDSATNNVAPPNWTVTGDVWFQQRNTGDAQDGSQHVRTQRKSFWQNTGVQMQAGVTYTLSFWTRQEVANEGVNNVRGLIFAAPDSTSIGWYPILTYVETCQTAAETWEQWTRSYTCSAANAGKYLMIMVDGSERYGHYTNIDNVVLTPEPATLALLSLGAILLRRRG